MATLSNIKARFDEFRERDAVNGFRQHGDFILACYVVIGQHYSPVEIGHVMKQINKEDYETQDRDELVAYLQALTERG